MRNVTSNFDLGTVHYFRYVVFLIVRIAQKFPFIKIIQIAKFGDIRIVMVPKCGTRSIRDALVVRYTRQNEVVNLSTEKKNFIASQKYEFCFESNFGKYARNKNIYLIERSWDERIQSAWMQKSNSKFNVLFYYKFFLPKNSTMYDFQTLIKKLPDYLREKHVSSYQSLTEAQSVKKIPLENLDDLLKMVCGTVFRSNRSNK